MSRTHSSILSHVFKAPRLGPGHQTPHNQNVATDAQVARENLRHRSPTLQVSTANRASPIGRSSVIYLLALLTFVGCERSTSLSVATGETFAELRAVKGEITVKAPGALARAPLPRERLVEGEQVTLPPGALSWMRRDAGATWLVKGPAQFTVRTGNVELSSGRAFVDTEAGPPVAIATPRGPVELSDARASVEVLANKETVIYVLRGTVRAANAGRAGPGELVTLHLDGTSARTAQVAWDDWTGGLATADPAADPAPFGMGTVGARPPGDKGKPRFSLVVQRLDVNVTVDHDFAVTEVDQTFVNPSSDIVEGIFSFRTPPAAVLQRFGVDRNGDLVWGRIQESALAVKQYESNVYAGSTEDPALLQWVGRGAYNARLYPIGAGTSRRVVTRYSEWLPRNGPRGERRLYVYPMAAEGAKSSLPRIEELTVTFDLSHAAAHIIRAGMGGKREGDKVIVKAFDFVPRADLSVELFDDGQADPVAYRAPHALAADDAPEKAEAGFADKVSKEEPDYLLIPLRAKPATIQSSHGLDLAIVVDTSAATEPGALAIARSMAAALLAHLGPDDRAALWAGDATLRPVVDGSGALSSVDAARRRAWLAGLSGVERGGATDLGALLTDAASKLDPKRPSAVVYIGDGLPTVGEIAPKALRERLARLSQTTRVLVAALGSNANLPLLEKLARGAPVEPIGDAYGAARAALRLLEAAGRPMWLGATVDLGSGVERLLPRELPPIGMDENVLVVGRITGASPSAVTIRDGIDTLTRRLSVIELADLGDLRRRWGEARLAELIEEGAGRSALVEIGRRFGLVSPFTSIYVPTKREVETAEESPETKAQELADRRRRWKPWLRSPAEYAARAVEEEADVKEGGTGTRAKGEVGSMGRHTMALSGPSAVHGLKDKSEPHAARAAAQREAQEFGAIGLLNAPPPAASAGGSKQGAELAPVAEPVPAVPAKPQATGATNDELRALDNAPAVNFGRAEREEEKGPYPTQLARKSRELADGAKKSNNCSPGDPLCDSAETSNVIRPGAAGVGLGNLGAVAGGGLADTGSFGKGRLSGNHKTVAPIIRMGAVTVSGRLPPEVIQRTVRQSYGRFRLCYEKGLERNPNLQGRISTRFQIGRDGSASNAANAGSDLPDQAVVDCVVNTYTSMSFPMPEGGLVTVVYPLLFAPGQGAASRQNPSQDVARVPHQSSPPGPLGAVGHEPRPCGPAADLPLDERRVLWRERLSSVGSPGEAIAIYRQALSDCEAPGWRERQSILIYMVDRMGSVRQRVDLWQALLKYPGAADVVYRSMIVRIQSAQELRELHDALGLERIDPSLLAGILKQHKSAAERLTLLHNAALRWPDDAELALQVLDAYEDASDDAGGRAWARRLRRRVDATAHVHTNIGEYYLRLSQHESNPAKDRDANEARRAFGELVEFAPEAPVARRRLGDLLRTHGWYEEAFRQYETLAQLAPDDASIPLLLAAAAQGMGKVEEAVRWAEKAMTVGSPDGTSELSRSARALASAFLAWACDDARSHGRKDEADRLLNRVRRLANAESSGNVSIHFLLTWSHPELRPALWTSALGILTPAADNFPLFGVAQAFVPATPAPSVQLRLDTEDAERAARLGAQATLTAIAGEGTDAERVAHLAITFGTAGQPVDHVNVTLTNGALHQEAL